MKRTLQVNTIKQETFKDLRIEKKDIPDKDAQEIIIIIGHNDILEKFQLSDCQISGRNLASIVHALSDKLSLTHLDLGNNKISDIGSMYLTGSLNNLTNLTYLNLSGNPIGNPFSPKGLMCLAHSLNNLVNLTHLDLEYTGIGVEGIECLAPSLANKPLISLNLKGNKITDSGLVKLMPHLSEINSLKEVGFCGNDLTDGSAEILALMLKRGINELDVTNNDLTDQGGKIIYDTLEQLNEEGKINPKVCIYGNDINDDLYASIRYGFRGYSDEEELSLNGETSDND